MIDAIHKIVSFIKETKYNIGFIQESILVFHCNRRKRLSASKAVPCLEKI